MIKKIDILRGLMAAGDWRRAIALASKFSRLGEHKYAISAAQSAYTNPRFYIQIGKNPDELIANGKAALIARYGAPGNSPADAQN